jgi:hypothetical protein
VNRIVRLALPIFAVFLHACGGRAQSADLGQLADAGDAGDERPNFEPSDATDAGDEPAPAEENASFDVTAEADAVPGMTCWMPDSGPIPEIGWCGTDVAPCTPALDDCLHTALGGTLTEIANECGAYCGELAVGFRSGCATTVVVDYLGVVSPYSEDEVVSCIRNRIMGGRWSCGPTDGWARVFVGSCTIQ